MSTDTMLLLTPIGLALITYAVSRHFNRAPTPDQQRDKLIEETRAALLHAEIEQENWNAEVPKLRTRLNRLERESKAQPNGVTA